MALGFSSLQHSTDSSIRRDKIMTDYEMISLIYQRLDLIFVIASLVVSVIGLIYEIHKK